MKKLLSIFSIVMVVTSGCASAPNPRPELDGLVELDKGMSRIYISAGELGGNKLWSVNQVGPVYLNNKKLGSTAKDEHFVVDINPGTYEFYCSQEIPDEKLYKEKRNFEFVAGETRYFACDIKLEKNIGTMFGLAGALASKYLGRSYLEEKETLDSSSKLVAYSKFNGA